MVGKSEQEMWLMRDVEVWICYTLVPHMLNSEGLVTKDNYFKGGVVGKRLRTILFEFGIG